MLILSIAFFTSSMEFFRSGICLVLFLISISLLNFSFWLCTAFLISLTHLSVLVAQRVSVKVLKFLPDKIFYQVNCRSPCLGAQLLDDPGNLSDDATFP